MSDGTEATVNVKSNSIYFSSLTVAHGLHARPTQAVTGDNFIKI